MYFRIANDTIVEGPIDLPLMWIDGQGISHPLLEMHVKGYTSELAALGWLPQNVIATAHDQYTHYVSDYTNVINGSQVDSTEVISALTGEALAIATKEKDNIDKLTGVLFDGVMCSATSADMWGLKAVEDWIAGGQTVNFEFDNGNVLELTSANKAAFEAVWIPFRASFFS